MAIYEERLNEEEQIMDQPVQVAELPPMTRQEQAESTLMSNEPPKEIETGSPNSIDLSIPANKAKRDEEYNVWWNMDRNDETRADLEDLWYRKYYGKSKQ